LENQTDTVSINGRTYAGTYDAASRTTTSVTPEGRQSTTQVDALGRPIQIQITGFLSVYLNYDSQGRLVNATQGSGAEERSLNLQYNTSGSLTTLTDSLGLSQQFEYDAAGRMTRGILPEGRVVEIIYDKNGNPTSIKPPGQPAHIFSYTAVGKVADYTPPDVGIGAKKREYIYNADRQLTQIVRPDGKTVDIDYDAAGRKRLLTIPRGTYTYDYDAATGTMTTIISPDGEGLSFDHDGPFLTGSTWTGTVAGNVTWALDDNLRITSRSVNGENTVNLAYNNDGLLTQAGSLVIDRDTQTGLITETTLGVVSDATVSNGFGELSQYTTARNGTTLYDVQYHYDTIGRITQKIETIGGVNDTYDYAYDMAGRLTEVQKNSAVIAAWTYDTNGNRLTATDSFGNRAGTYDAQDRLLTYGGYSYAYTAAGELVSKTNEAGTTTYDYDVLGNLMGVTLPDGTEITYGIDGSNRRIGKSINGTLVQGFLYKDFLRPIAELDGDNNVVSRFVYGTKPNVPDYMEKNGVTYRIISDHLGSPRLVVNTTDGTIVQRMDYDAYGNVLNDTNPGFQPFGFAAGLYDPDTGLTRFGMRDYEAEIGRWTVKDPILFSGKDTNLYAYAFNDPVNRTDPSGLLESNPGVGCQNFCAAICKPLKSCGDTGDYSRCYFPCVRKCDSLVDLLPRNPFIMKPGSLFREAVEAAKRASEAVKETAEEAYDRAMETLDDLFRADSDEEAVSSEETEG
jgi:RHS repeat-associated protein